MSRKDVVKYNIIFVTLSDTSILHFHYNCTSLVKLIKNVIHIQSKPFFLYFIASNKVIEKEREKERKQVREISRIVKFL